MFGILSGFLQALINVIGGVLGTLIGLLPKSPFTYLSASGFGSLIAQINYFIPIYEFVTILETWLIAVGLYYIYSIWARWVKAIE